ncbi:MAG: SGNH/GDSL hydrolase family protein [Armatimonadota bacterium]
MASVQTQIEQDIVWHAPYDEPFQLCGFPWFGGDRIFRRLPLRLPKPLPPAVELLSWCTAGGQVRFTSDTDILKVKVRLREQFGMDCAPPAGPYGFEHMAHTGVSGFDLYLGEPGAERFWGVTRFPSGAQEYECQLLGRAGRAPLSFILNFPLFNGVEELQIGIGAGASVEAPPPYRLDRPVVVYGTSITHGGCASRPGACYTNILSRRLNVPVVNLGFSGSGQGEREVAEAIATVQHPALFVLDYEANSGGKMDATLPGFIEVLRAAHPDTPILVVSRIRFGKESLKSEPGIRKAGNRCRAYQKGLVEHLRAAGDQQLHFFDGAKLLGRDYDECTVDGVHPNDLGFFKMAHGLAPVIQALLF